MNFYRNREGYADPTAGAALSRIAGEERRKREQRRKRKRIRTRVWRAKEHEHTGMQRSR